MIRRYLQTLRYLPASQLFRRAQERLYRQIALSQGPVTPKEDHVLPFDESARSGFTQLAAQFLRRRPKAWSASDPEYLTFLHQKLHLGFPPQWNLGVVFDRANDPALWFFHLHYLDWIWDVAAEAPAKIPRVLSAWDRDCRLGAADCFTGPWSSYTIARRLPNLMAIAATVEMDTPSHAALLSTIRAQESHLRRHLEWEHRGNHLLENMHALYLTDAFFGRRTNAPRLYREQLQEQTGHDGFHHEYSPMYHAAMTVRVLDALMVRPAAFLDRYAVRMANCIESLTMPDGRLPLLGDSVQNTSPSPQEILRRAEEISTWRPSPSTSGLKICDGHFRFTPPQPDGIGFLFDAAPLCVDHCGAHAHADLLNLTVYVGNRRIITAGGSGFYGEGKLRSTSRASREHAVIEVKGTSCADPWKSFRLGRRGKVRKVRYVGRDSRVVIEATHDGFSPEGVLHRRRIIATGDRLICRDQLFPMTQMGSHARLFVVRSYWPLDPNVCATFGETVSLFDKASGRALLLLKAPRDAKLTVEKGTLYEDFGVGISRDILVVEAQRLLRRPLEIELLLPEG